MEPNTDINTANPDSSSVWSSTATETSLPARRSTRARRQQQRVIHVEGIPDSVPAFLRKTFYILECGEFEDCIRWSEDGQVLTIPKVKNASTACDVTCIILASTGHKIFNDSATPVFQAFKLCQFRSPIEHVSELTLQRCNASLMRARRRYGFHKTSPDPACREFKHDSFIRGRPELVSNIKRKVSGASRPKLPKQGDGHKPEMSAAISTDPPTSHSVGGNQLPENGLRQPLATSATQGDVRSNSSVPEQPGHIEPAGSGSVLPQAGGSFQQFLTSSSAFQSRKDMDSMLEEIVKLRASQERLQQQIALMKQRAHASETTVSAIEREAAHSTSRQGATQRRLERLMMFTYELYKSLWLVHQRASVAQRSQNGGQLPATLATPMLTDGTMLDSNAAGNAVQQMFFSAQGLVPPDQFVRMLDYVDVDTPSFAAIHRDPSSVLRLQDGQLQDTTNHHGIQPPALGAPVPAAGALQDAAALAKDLASDQPPAQKQARLAVGDGSTLAQKRTVQQVQALGSGPSAATAAPADIFTRQQVPAVRPPQAGHALDANSLPSKPDMGFVTPSLHDSGSAIPHSQAFSPPPAVSGAGRTGHPVPDGEPRQEGALTPSIDSLAGASPAQAMAGQTAAPGDFAAELSSLVDMQDELSSAQHVLLGNLASTDANLARDFPEEHAAFLLQQGEDSLNSGSQGDSDPAGLKLVDLDFE